MNPLGSQIIRFFSWFLENHTFKEQVVYDLLHWLIDSPNLNRIKIVEDNLEMCNYLVTITACEETNEVPSVMLYAEGYMPEDPVEIIDIVTEAVNDNLEPVCFNFNFPAKHKRQYQEVLIENPFSPYRSKKARSDRERFDKAIEELEVRCAIASVEDEIDEALSAGDKEKFIELSNKLKELKLLTLDREATT